MSTTTLTAADTARIHAAIDQAWDRAEQVGDDDVILDALNAVELLYGRQALRDVLTGKAPRTA